MKDESKKETTEVNHFYHSLPDSPQSSEEEKNDPQKMDQDDKISQHLVNHIPSPLPKSTRHRMKESNSARILKKRL